LRLFKLETATDDLLKALLSSKPDILTTNFWIYELTLLYVWSIATILINLSELLKYNTQCPFDKIEFQLNQANEYSLWQLIMSKKAEIVCFRIQLEKTFVTLLQIQVQMKMKDSIIEILFEK
jgi:hypothetical protein